MSTIMQNKKTAIKDWIEKQYHDSLDAVCSEASGLKSLKADAYKKLEEGRFPTRRDEDWKYTNFNKALNLSYTKGESTDLSEDVVAGFSFPEMNANKLVFVNGILNQKYSNYSDLEDGISIIPIATALEDASLASWINKTITEEGDTGVNAFIHMNKALTGNGFVITVDKNVKINRPIHFIYIADASSDAHMVHPQIMIQANQGSDVSVLESYHSTSNNSNSYFNNTANWIDVQDNANVNFYRLQFESKSAKQVNNTVALQGRDSVFSHYSVDFGGEKVRNNLNTILKGSGTMTNYYGAYLGDDNQHIDNQTYIDHAMPHCDSNELYKGVLTDKAKGTFNGKVLVRQDAQKTNAFQQNSSLVLSDDAVMNAKPQLEIYADDVKCSHGATIGQLDEASIFYLKSRGIPDSQAKNLLQKAFVGDVINNFPIDSVRSRILEMVDEKLSRS